MYILPGICTIDTHAIRSRIYEYTEMISTLARSSTVYSLRYLVTSTCRPPPARARARRVHMYRQLARARARYALRHAHASKGFFNNNNNYAVPAELTLYLDDSGGSN
jgi:hypothetical protein